MSSRFLPCRISAKAAANFAKHGVSFSAAARTLKDPRKIEVLDDRFDYTEERLQSLCMDRGKVLFVVTVAPMKISAAS